MNSWLRRVVLFVCCFFALEYLMAQETIVVGQVLDKLTGDPVAYANIYFKNSKIGTASNDEGWFMLRTNEKHPKQLLVSAIGYKTMRFKVEQGQYVGLQVELSEDNAILQEVVAMPGVNPEYVFMPLPITYGNTRKLSIRCKMKPTCLSVVFLRGV